MAEQENNLKPDASASTENKRSFLQDMEYTGYHAASCLFTDSLIQPIVGTGVHEVEHNPKLQADRWKWLRWVTGMVGKTTEAHEHDHEHKLTFSSFLRESGHWFGGEIIGDLAAVPLTATVAHFCPWLMKGMRKVIEPIFGVFFEKGARRDAKLWAEKHGFDPNGPEAEAKRKELYEYEASHFGHIFTWNFFSTIINVFTQFFVRNWEKARGHHAHDASIGELFRGKIFGLIFSNSILISARAIKPTFFQRNEVQATKAAAQVFGHKEHSDERPSANAPKSPERPNKEWAAATARERLTSVPSVSIT